MYAGELASVSTDSARFVGNVAAFGGGIAVKDGFYVELSNSSKYDKTAVAFLKVLQGSMKTLPSKGAACMFLRRTDSSGATR